MNGHWLINVFQSMQTNDWSEYWPKESECMLLLIHDIVPRSNRRGRNILESHLSRSTNKFAIRRPIFKLRYLSNQLRYKKGTYIFWKFGNLSFIMALDSCNYLNLSSVSMVLKKSFQNYGILLLAEIAHFQHFLSFWKNAGLWEAVAAKRFNPYELMGRQ